MEDHWYKRRHQRKQDHSKRKIIRGKRLLVRYKNYVILGGAWRYSVIYKVVQQISMGEIQVLLISQDVSLGLEKSYIFVVLSMQSHIWVLHLCRINPDVSKPKVWVHLPFSSEHKAPTEHAQRRLVSSPTCLLTIAAVASSGWFLFGKSLQNFSLI